MNYDVLVGGGLTLAGGIITGLLTLIGVYIQNRLNNHNLEIERKYQFNKEELLYYRKIGEKLIQKILLLDNHREVFKNYLQFSYEETKLENNKFVDINDTFNKDKFENEQEEIATYIFLYFNELGDDWNECLSLMGEIHSNLFIIDLNRKTQPQYKVNWESEIVEFNKLQEKLGDKPYLLAKRIRELIKEKELNILK